MSHSMSMLNRLGPIARMIFNCSLGHKLNETLTVLSSNPTIEGVFQNRICGFFYLHCIYVVWTQRYIIYYQTGYQPPTPFGGLTPIWWLNAWKVYLLMQVLWCVYFIIIHLLINSICRFFCSGGWKKVEKKCIQEVAEKPCDSVFKKINFI